MAITGVHALLYSAEPEELRRVLRDVVGWEGVDSGDGWLIFRLPPAELGIHPAGDGDGAGGGGAHELSLMCDDLAATTAELEADGVAFKGEPSDQGWGVVATMVLPGGVEMLLYEPRHQTAI